MNQKKPIVTVAVFLLWLTTFRPVCSADKNPLQEQARPWKWDATIYDRPGWSTPEMEPPRLLGDEIILRCTSHPENVYADDFYAEKSEVITLSSGDGGRSWQRAPDERYEQAAPAPPEDAFKASLDTRPSFSHELDRQRRELLKQAGLGELADKGTGWTVFPESMAQQLKDLGYDVYDAHPYIPKGQVAVYSMNLVGKWSSDSGQTWHTSRVDALPAFAHGPVPNGERRLANGTRLLFCYGIPLREKGRYNYVLRSTDKGQSWTTTQIKSDPAWYLNEASPLVLQSGRILLLLRCDAGSGVGYMYTTWSDDNAQTWQPAERSPIWGQPIGAICLKSGAVLCSYGYRRFPGGIRACLSRDEGKTWDIEHEKILRDDIIPSPWIAPCRAHSLQLADGTIFTAFNVQKATVLKEGDTAGGNIFRVTSLNGLGQFHCYLAGCRYTEDYVRPLCMPGKPR